MLITTIMYIPTNKETNGSLTPNERIKTVFKQHSIVGKIHTLRTAYYYDQWGFNQLMF